MRMMRLFSCTMGASFVAGNHWVWSGIRLVCAVSDPIKATAIPLDVGLPHPTLVRLMVSDLRGQQKKRDI